MADVDPRNARLFESIDAATQAIESLPAETRQAYPHGVARASDVLAYSRLVLERTDFEVAPSGAHPGLTTSLELLASNIQAAVQAPDGYVDPILTTLNVLPVARDREMEQAVRGAAANFQRAAAQRLRSVEAAAEEAQTTLEAHRAALQTELDSLQTDLGATKAQFSQEIDTLASGFQQRLAEYDATLLTLRQSFDQTLTRHSEAFSEAQAGRTTEFATALTDAQARLQALEEDAGRQIDERVAEIRRMERESAGLVGAIGLAGTAERYGEEAIAQKQIADRMRTLTICLAIGAIGMAIFAVVHNPEDAHATAAKLGVSAVFGALAAYTARQSGRHRIREERSRNLQLELTAFAPFIEPLEEEQQELERVLMTRKTFGRVTALPEADDAHAYGPLGPVLDRLRRKTQDSEAKES